MDDAPLGSFSLDVMHLRESGAYRAVLDKVRPCFSSWRAIAKSGSRLWTVLRLGSIEFCLAVVDAARESGWMLNLAESQWVATDEQPFPLLAFVARDPEMLDDEVLVAWFGSAPTVDPDEFPGATPHLDVLRYRNLADRVVTATRDFRYLDGHTMRVEVGTTGDHTYVFQRATTGFTQLQFLTPEQAELIQLESMTVEQLPIEIDRPLGIDSTDVRALVGSDQAPSTELPGVADSRSG